MRRKNIFLNLNNEQSNTKSRTVSILRLIDTKLFKSFLPGMLTLLLGPNKAHRFQELDAMLRHTCLLALISSLLFHSLLVDPNPKGVVRRVLLRDVTVSVLSLVEAQVVQAVVPATGQECNKMGKESKRKYSTLQSIPDFFLNLTFAKRLAFSGSEHSWSLLASARSG